MVKSHRKITKREAQAIHGNMNFAMSFVMGQTLKVSSRAFTSLSMESFSCRPKHLLALCEWTHGVLSVLAPRRIDPNGSTIPVLVFTDAAYEGESGIATRGAAIIDPHRGPFGSWRKGSTRFHHPWWLSGMT